MKNITRRESHVLPIALPVMIIILSLFSMEYIIKHQVFFLLAFVTPIGLYIATDPERRLNK